MKSKMMIMVGFFFTFLSTKSGRAVELNIGESKSISYSQDIIAIDLSENNIVDINVDPSKRNLMIEATQTGAVFITVKFKDESSETLGVSVMRRGYTETALQGVERILNKIPGTSHHIKNQSIVIEGSINTISEGMLFDQLLDKFGDSITDNTNRPYKDFDSITNRINNTLHTKGLANYVVRNVGKIMYIEGSPRSEEEKNIVLDIVKTINPNIKNSISSESSISDMIVIDILFLQLTRQKERKVGFLNESSDNAGINYGEYKVFQFGGHSPLGRYSYTIGPLNNMLNLVGTHSNAKIFANPKVVVRSGQTAEFHTGNQIYTTTQSVSAPGGSVDGDDATTVNISNVQLVTNTELIDTGVNVTVTPTAKPLNVIDLDLDMDISDFSLTAVSGKEARVKSSLITNISLKDGYTVVINGFKKSTKKKSIERIPLLADIPIIGELFKHRHFEQDSEDILVLITAKSSALTDDEVKLFETIDNLVNKPESWLKLQRKANRRVSFNSYD